MKFKTTSNRIKSLYTSYSASIGCTFADLVKTFGEPLKASQDGKTTAHWIIVFEDDIIATIYDYRCPVDYKNNRDWHIGSNSLITGDALKARIEAAVAA